MLESLTKYVLAARRLPAAEFASNYPDSVFLVQPFQSVDDTSFQTLVGFGKARGDTVTVARIVKQPDRNAFQLMITIGRASNNDIQFKSPGISKFHAFIQKGPDAVLRLTDSGSTYGTVINGEKLEPKTATVLRSGDEVQFSESIKATFLDALDFHTWLTNPKG